MAQEDRTMTYMKRGIPTPTIVRYEPGTEFPTPAVGKRATNDTNESNSKSLTTHDQLSSSSSAAAALSTTDTLRRNSVHPPPGTLPESASGLSSASRGLLMRLLDRDPRVRMRNLRQLQQSAFYMGFNFEHIKAKKVSPKSVLERYFPGGELVSSRIDVDQSFVTFDQPTFV